MKNSIKLSIVKYIIPSFYFYICINFMISELKEGMIILTKTYKNFFGKDASLTLNAQSNLFLKLGRI